jgi:hypothetical protein
MGLREIGLTVVSSLASPGFRSRPFAPCAWCRIQTPVHPQRRITQTVSSFVVTRLPISTKSAMYAGEVNFSIQWSKNEVKLREPFKSFGALVKHTQKITDPVRHTDVTLDREELCVVITRVLESRRGSGEADLKGCQHIRRLG